jgi:hypothetical protein
MKTTFDVEDIIWQHLNGSSLDSAITGNIYKVKRPFNSNVEDVVINVLPLNNLELQTGVINVNIFVPNFVINVNQAQDHTQPNRARLKLLTGLAIGLLEEIWVDDYTFTVQQQILFEDPESKSHYSNIRLDFYNINI